MASFELIITGDCDFEADTKSLAEEKAEEMRIKFERALKRGRVKIESLYVDVHEKG